MKKLIAIGLILVLVALVSACSSTTNTEKNDIVKKENTLPPSPPPLPSGSVGDPVLDNIADAPVELVDGEELDTVMDDISMDEW